MRGRKQSDRRLDRPRNISRLACFPARLPHVAHWINTHGVEALLVYLAYAGIVGAIPPLPKTAGFWAQWGYGALHAVAMNLRTAAQLMGMKVPTEDGLK